MVEVVKYSDGLKPAWDTFIRASKNGTFMLQRAYMEYHTDRFQDHSLLFYNKGKLVAVLPANEAGEELHSHAGLSYGGVLSGRTMKASLMLEVFEALISYCRSQKFRRVFYKAIPAIYHQLPAEEDLYALFRQQATLYRRDVNSVIRLDNKLPYATLRKRKLKQEQGLGLEVKQSQEYAVFMQMEQELLQEKYGISPAHTADGMLYLASLFPDNIKLYAVHEAQEMIAGIIVYETATVAHCQYIASTKRGRETAALDLLVDNLLTEVYPHKAYFSFGVSTEQQGLCLNENLIRNKESFGARTIVHDFYRLEL